VYKSPDASFLAEYVFFPCYDKIVTFYPRSWRPNSITLFGIVSTVLGSLLMLFCLPTSTKFDRPFSLVPLPGSSEKAIVDYGEPRGILACLGDYGLSGSILLIVAGVLNGIYCVADNTDGRQARRTKQTSFTGEYLDHGLDCVTSLMSTFLITLCFGAPTLGAIYTTVCVATVTTLAHILHFSNKIFIWGNRMVSVDEAMVGFALVPIIRSVLGHAIIQGPLLETGYAIVDAGVLIFAIVNVFALLGIAKKNWDNLINPSFLAIVAANAFLIAFAGIHDQSTTGTFLPYPAVWGISYALTASIIAHIPILAQCARVTEQDFWPLGLLFFDLLTFAACPVGGMVLLLLTHLVQILCNLSFITKVGEQRAAQAKSA
jgi:phosphatidylglycerophosphate synthase